MIRVSAVLILACGLLGLPAIAASEADAPPAHALTVSGTGVGLYPAFAADVQRYGVTTTSATGGSVSVSATTDDPQGVVLVDGKPTTDGRATVTGLGAGDEISVIFQDEAGTEVHSLVYLPDQFPRLTTVVDSTDNSPGSVLLTLMKTTPAPGFEVAVDRNGVPVFVDERPVGQSSLDLKPAPGGGYSVARSPTTLAGRTGALVTELDSSFAPVRTLSTVGLTDTDGHDAILRPDGSRILVAYEHNAVSGRQDAVIQEVDAQGHEVYTWNSSQHLDPDTETTSTPGTVDYAHINSIEELPGGDILASFRNLSAVYRIAWSARGNLSRGDIVWRLGGRHSDFTFPDDPDGGPCAQHSAGMLANGHVLVFDNGNAALGSNPGLCVDPADRTGPTVDRGRSRAAEYALDTQAGTASLVWSYAKSPPYFAYFAGSARRLAGGNTLIDWAADTHAIATEVTPAGSVAWELKNDDGYLSYRAVKAVVPDTVRPAVTVSVPAAGASYAYGQRVAPSVRCTDRGGSSLRTCSAPRALDTRAAGRHTYRATATDGAGNTSTVMRSYTVAAAPYSRPDAIIRGLGGWVGNNVYGSPARQQVSRVVHRGGSATSWVRLQNEGNRTDRVVVRGTGGNQRFRVRYYLGRTDFTTRVRAGTFVKTLSANRSFDLRLVVTRLRPATLGSSLRVVVLAASGHDARRRDAVAETVRAVR